MAQDTHILIVDRDAVAAEALRHTLGTHGYSADTHASGDAAIEALQRARSVGDRRYGAALIDQDTAGAGGIGLVRRLHDGWPDVVPVVISAYRKVESAVAVMRLGAADYLLKPVGEAGLLDAVGRAVQRHLLLVEHATRQSPPPKPAKDLASTKPSAGNASAGEQAAWSPMPLAEAMKGPERRILLAALEANGWNRGQTARQLEINRTTLYKKIRQYRLDEPA